MPKVEAVLDQAAKQSWFASKGEKPYGIHQLARRARLHQADHASRLARGTDPDAARGDRVIPLFLDIKEGTTEEFKRAVAPFEPLVAKLADVGCDLIHAEGAPPFMLLGYDGEAKLLDKWEKKYKVPMFTSGTNHVRALKALGVKRFVGATYFTGQINNLFAKYFTEAGFDVLGMEGMSAARSKTSAKCRRTMSMPT